MFHGVPVIGLSGGVGSGKSFVGTLLEEMGCVKISSDELVRTAYDQPAVRDQLHAWWGDSILKLDGSIDRAAVGSRIFQHPLERQQLEQLLHPAVAAEREAMMRAAVKRSPAPKAFVWDSPLLFETGLNQQCDALIFVDAPPEIRQRRLALYRGWKAEEMLRREKTQMGLDKKRSLSNYLVVNTDDAEHVRGQLRAIFPRIIDRADLL